MGVAIGHVMPGLPLMWFAIYVMPEPHGLMLIGVISLIANIYTAVGAWQGARAEKAAVASGPAPEGR
jgi:hypothetical protein